MSKDGFIFLDTILSDNSTLVPVFLIHSKKTIKDLKSELNLGK